MIISTAPGKVILTGEHAVVYGQPAIVAAVQMRTNVTIGEGNARGLNLVESALRTISKVTGREIPSQLNIGVNTTLPIGSGLGSSASVAAAIVGGISEYLHLNWNREKINEVTYEIEKLSHGNPSGVDNTAVVYGGLLRFERGMNGNANILDNLKVNKILEKLWLIDGGKPMETTGDMVAFVDEKHKLQPNEFNNYFEQIGNISNKLQLELEEDKFSPEWISENERLLEKLEVVGDKAKYIIKNIEKMGGYAKVCGAGGIKDGSGVILAYHPDDNKFENWLRKKEYTYFQDHLGGLGWQIEK